MATFLQNWIAQRSSEFDDWVDIDYVTFTGTIGSVTRGLSTVIGGELFNGWVGGFQETDCFVPSASVDPTTLPAVADPPFPPVYPYFFSTEDIYGRDHLSLNIKMVRGDTYKFDAAIILNGSPVDITGGTVRMTAKWSLANLDAAAVFQLSSATTGIVITSATAGEIQVTIAAANTSSLPAKKVELPYDIQFVDSIGAVYTVLYGTLTVVPDATITV